MQLTKLVLMRHGESVWNQENRFTGWVDVDLSDQGYCEAKSAGKLLKNHGLVFDYGYTSVLKRAIHTLWMVLEQLDQSWLTIKKSWKLNERHYGVLQGLNKNEALKKYGHDTIHQWRRSFDAIPPKMENNNQFLGTEDIRYNKIKTADLPNGESLKFTWNRVIPYWNQYIIPKIKSNNIVIIVAHGNSIRSIIKFLDNLNESEIFNIEVPTAKPLIYEFDRDANPINHYYLI